jgi:hypothetical protein
MISTAKGFLDELAAFPPDNYRGISTTDLIVYVASEMESHGVKLAFEPIVAAAFRMFPKAFALVGFPEYPDASRVGRTLLQCRPKYRGLIRGGASSGFVITELGRVRADEVAVRLSSGKSEPRVVRRRAAPRAILDRIEQEVRDSAAFTSWRANQRVSEYDFYYFLHLLPGSSKASVSENFNAIDDVAKDSQDPQIRSFLAALKAQYAKELMP